jgi:hypothetical protein
MKPRFGPRHPLILAVLVALISSVGLVGAAHAAVVTDDRLLAPSATQIGTFAGVPYVQYDGIFEGQTSTGAFRVPYRITAAADPGLGNGTVLVEPSHFGIGLGALEVYLRPDLLFTRGFAHAGIGWSTTSFGPGFDRRILDPTVPGVFIEGGFADHGGRTDYEIITDFAAALAGDSQAASMLGRVARRYVTGFSDSSAPIMDLVASGAAGVFDLALPFTAEGDDPQLAIQGGRYNGKLIIVESEADKSGNLVDRGVATNQYRFFAVAGTPHVPDHLEIPSFSSGSTPASFEPALRAHFLQGDRWVKNGTPPPPSYQFKTSRGNKIDRDGNGNAITVNPSGQRVPRLPVIELGEARFITGFVGSYDNVKTIAELGFTTDGAYLKRFRDTLSDYAAAGYILSEEAAAMRARAALCPPLTYTETYRDHYDNFVAIASCAA